jgi:hypothetical protein
MKKYYCRRAGGFARHEYVKPVTGISIISAVNVINVTMRLDLSASGLSLCITERHDHCEHKTNR